MPQISHQGMRFWRHAGLASLLAVALASLSCSSDNTLEGSITEILNMSFTEVQVAVTEAEVVVSYRRPSKAGDSYDVVLKLVAQVAPADVTPDMAVDLSPEPDGTPRATVTRAVAEDPIHTLATVIRGTLTLDAVPTVDQPVSGEFRVTLGEGGDAGKGRTAYGHFQASQVVPGN